VYEEIEFDCNHFGVFENAIDMAHIHYLHGDSFGNQVGRKGVKQAWWRALLCGGLRWGG
jgi:phenylpropionate dioxygenase-like ring-hydroxylating dioxygenase large terminal subunit